MRAGRCARAPAAGGVGVSTPVSAPPERLKLDQHTWRHRRPLSFTLGRVCPVGAVENVKLRQLASETSCLFQGPSKPGGGPSGPSHGAIPTEASHLGFYLLGLQGCLGPDRDQEMASEPAPAEPLIFERKRAGGGGGKT